MTSWTVSRFIKFAISCLVRAFDGLADLASQALRSRPASRCVVLYYHEVTPHLRARFARQLDIIARHSQPIRLDQPALFEPGKRYAAVTFDDGFCSVIENALPELEKRSIPATFFVVAAALGQPRSWASRAAYDSALNERVMSADQLSKLPALVTIGSHTLTHPFLPAVSETVARRELSESRRLLESLVGRKVDLFSFPYGGFSPDLVQWCADAGYSRVFTTEPVYALTDNREFVSGRVEVSPEDSNLEFHLKLFGSYRWLPYAVSYKRRIRQWMSFGATPN